MVKEARDGIEKIRKKLIMAQSRQKSYADKRRRPLEFTVGDKEFLKGSPRRCIQRNNKKGKLAPQFVVEVEEDGRYTFQPMMILNGKDKVTRSSVIPLVKVL
ncbi:uncharacterized protein LOC119998580 [Tripterygium wilfordii]|uniref:uncharacterized protein LOC119998580 n=1 Tax=Tripterygium wilfordii TaxID=458696 RepID=UPI0018F85F9E|nr:uncharacterized protein LOC119998580 [Tripterygium wilfordii]